MPGQPRRLKLEALNSTAVRVEWRPPEDDQQNGIIRGYHIHYMVVNDDSQPYGANDMYDLRGGARTEVVITGLQPSTNYQFQVGAYTRKGDGDRSRAKTVRTKGAGTSPATGGLQG